MRQIVIMPGGFHPFHAGHAALYQSALNAFPDADVYVAATNDTSERPFPFAIKEKLARVAGVPPGHFVQVKSPFTSEEITSKYDPNSTVLIFVKSEKNSKNGSDPEGPFPAEVDPATGKLPVVTRGPRKGQPVSNRLQYYKGNEKNLQPMSQHSYLAYLPTVKFGPGIKSGSELRNAWPKLDDRRKTAFVMSMYPATQKNDKLAANVVKMIDMGMGGQEGVAEGLLKEFVPPSSDRGDGGDSRSRRIRKLLEIAIQVAKEKNIDELGMIHGMNMIAGDDFFNTAVEGILPDITDKEYMFVLQSAYKKVKQGMMEGLGIPYPTTYEQENNKFKGRGPMRITAMTEFATPGSDDREPDEEEILRQLAAQWWNGSMQQMKKAQQTLQAMGWDIGQDESGDDDAGVFVIRIGDENGDSYIAFPHSELGLNEDYLNEI